MSPARSTTTRRWLAGSGVLAVVAASATLAFWPDSAADTARADGEQLGQAVSALAAADTQAEVDAARADVDTAATEARAHASDELAGQVAEQTDALTRAVDSAYGAATSEDDWEAELWEWELSDALDDLDDQASDFRAQGPEVHEAFWQGVEDGLYTETA